MPKVSHYNSIYILSNANPRYKKCLFTNIQKQQDMLKSSLLFKKNTNFTGWSVDNSRILRIMNAKFSRYCFYMNPNIWTACICFEFSGKLRMRTYLAGKTKINWKKNTRKVVNIKWTEFPPVSYLGILRKICHTVAQHLDVQIEGQLLLYFNYFYHIPSAKRYQGARNNKMGHS